MLFSSPVFIFIFLPIVFLINQFLPLKLSNYWLLLASLIFYSWGEPFYIVLMIFSSIINFFLAKAIEQRKKEKLWLFMTIFFNIGLLIIFKYTNFIIETVNSLAQTQFPLTQISLPIGISFYTFQTMSYVIDVYQNKTEAQHNYAHLLLYISFFPQLIAGPIVKYRDVAKQIEKRQVTLDNLVNGFQRFGIGLSKKLLLANSMAYVVDQIYAMPLSQISTRLAWISSFAYCFQIYFDFSGYSDMALGLGELFGFHFKENFNYPFMATSIQDFWRRWHISLSSWFKEYVYIPLGGNRKGVARSIINRLTVFFLTGLWHGASWTFVIWGLYNGFFLLLEILILKPNQWPKVFQHLYAIAVVLIGFIIFRADSLPQAIHLINQLFSFSSLTPESIAWLQINLDRRFVFLFLVCAILSTNSLNSFTKKLPQIVNLSISIVLWILCLVTLSAATYNPFIYFRF